jgi:hypothetical protein
MAVQGSNTMAGSTGVNNITNLGAPLFIEHYKIISDKKTMVNGSEPTEAVFRGNGTVNGISQAREQHWSYLGLMELLT